MKKKEIKHFNLCKYIKTKLYKNNLTKEIFLHYSQRLVLNKLDFK